jgi:23S rRNA pseudouridine2605 synthase
MPPGEGLLRLNKLLAASGACSRRRAGDLIHEGRVTVDGCPVYAAAAMVRASSDIRVDGVRVRTETGLQYVAYHKTTGVIVTRSDPSGRVSLLDVLPAELHGLQPVGRLDRETSGLLLLTNDGDFALRMTHPSHGVPKVYVAEIDGTLDEDSLARLRAGLLLRDGPTRPAEARVLERRPGAMVVELVLREGRRRQVRRMFARLHTPVVRLERRAIGPVTLEGIAPGEWRRLTETEATALLALASAARPDQG